MSFALKEAIWADGCFRYYASLNALSMLHKELIRSTPENTAFIPLKAALGTFLCDNKPNRALLVPGVQLRSLHSTKCTAFVSDIAMIETELQMVKSGQWSVLEHYI